MQRLLALGLIVALGWMLTVGVAWAQGPGYEVWVGNQANDLVAVIEPGTWQVKATVDVNSGGYAKGAKPHMLVPSPSGKYVYVANVGALANTNNVTVIRTADRKIVTQLQTGSSAHAAIPSHDGRRVWVYNTAINRITEVMADEAAEKWTVGRTIGLGVRPICGMFTPDNSHVYVTLGGNNDTLGALAVLNVASGEVVKRIELGREGCGTVLSRDRSRMYINSGWHARNPETMNDMWLAFNPSTHAQLRAAQLTGVKDNHGLQETPDGKELWIVNRQSSSVTIIDTASGAVKSVMGVADKPDILDFSPDGRYAFWTLRGEPQTGDPHALRGTTPGVEVFDVAARKSLAIIPIAGDVHGVTVVRTQAATTAPTPTQLPVTGAAPALAAMLLTTLGAALLALGLGRRR